MACSPPKPKPSRKRPAPQGTALVVDDSKTSRCLVGRALQRNGFQVTTVVNGLEGLRKMQTCCYDVAFVDFHMPVQTGINMLRSYRKWREENDSHPIHLVGMSASATEAEVELARAEGMHIFQRKPLTVKNMRSILSTVPVLGQKDDASGSPSSYVPAEEPRSENEHEPAHNAADDTPSVVEAACSQPSKRRRSVTEEEGGEANRIDDEAGAEEQAAAGAPPPLSPP